MASLQRLLWFTFGVGVTVLLFGMRDSVSQLPETHFYHGKTDYGKLTRAEFNKVQEGIQQGIRGVKGGLSIGAATGSVGGTAMDMACAGSAAAKLKVAFAITVTKDGPYLDGVAVLKQSILNTHPCVQFEFVAIVWSNVTESRPGLKSLGFILREFAPPLLAKDIRGKELRETIDKTGCCGSMELLKLRAYQLSEYDRVLLLDMDAMLVKNLDHLFVEPKMQTSLLFTWDHEMDDPASRSAAPPVHGGFLLLTPSEKHYQAMVDVVLEGDFRDSTGWAGSRIGWCWGGQTIQGLWSYYYKILAAQSESLELDPCEYNSMATTRECRYMDWERVMSVHFTWCSKPWELCGRGREPICERMHTHWWNMRKEFEVSNGLPVGPRCCQDGNCSARTYKKIKLELLPHF